MEFNKKQITGHRIIKNTAIILLMPIWIPALMLGYCAGIVWPMLYGGFIIGSVDSLEEK